MDITKINNYKDLFLDIDKFDDENIAYIKPILFYKVTKYMGIYYKKNMGTKKNPQFKKQKIIVQTPKMIVPFGIKEFTNKNKKSYQMTLSFSTLTNLYNEEEIKKFYYFIKNIDEINEGTILDYRKEWGLPKNIKYKKTLQRLSNDYPHYMNLNLPHDENMGFLFNTYDEKAEKANIDIIEKKSIVSVIMELTDLRFGETEFKANWTVLQIRKFKPYSPIQEFFLSGCFIIDNDDPEDKAYAGIIEAYKKKLSTPIMQHIQNPPPMNTNYHYMPPPPSQPSIANKPPAIIYKPPTLAELLDAKSTLKKTVTIEKIKEQGKVIDGPPPPPPPPPAVDKKAADKKTESPKKTKKSIKKSSANA